MEGPFFLYFEDLKSVKDAISETTETAQETRNAVVNLALQVLHFELGCPRTETGGTMFV